MAGKLQTEEGKEIYDRGKKSVELVFGQVKFNLGFRRFRLGGLDKPGGELDGLTGQLQEVYSPA